MTSRVSRGVEDKLAHSKYEKGGNTMQTIPIWEKTNLTLEEAAAYSNIGINKLREITNEQNVISFCGLAISGLSSASSSTRISTVPIQFNRLWSAHVV